MVSEGMPLNLPPHSVAAPSADIHNVPRTHNESR
jgi:hypothetical protein